MGVPTAVGHLQSVILVGGIVHVVVVGVVGRAVHAEVLGKGVSLGFAAQTEALQYAEVLHTNTDEVVAVAVMEKGVAVASGEFVSKEG